MFEKATTDLDVNRERCAALDRFVASTREALFVRRADSLLMIRPDKTMGVNRTAVEILAGLYNRDGTRAARVLERLTGELGVDFERLLDDTEQLVEAVGAILNQDFSPRSCLRFSSFDRQRVAFPTLAEIALTYGCQNRCQFCYASSPDRADEHRPMSTEQVCRVMDKIYHQAHVPSLSFTGGESTLRKDLPALIAHGAGLGLRVNLITNGIRAAEPGYADSLAAAGLASAQVSLEAASQQLHDAIVRRPGAWDKTVAGVGLLRRAGLHVHTNTTLCAANLDSAGELIRFVAGDLGLPTMSMNMVIRTGLALDGTPVGLTYTQVAERLPGLLEVARAEGVTLVWYSPIPYCIFNPVLHGLGAKSCACVDGILSVDPAGKVLPCSSFAGGIGSLLDEDFDHVYHGRRARYWRTKRFVPPVCAACPDADVCAGACPLYWDAAGTFAELPVEGADDLAAYRRWARARRKGGSFGVAPPDEEL